MLFEVFRSQIDELLLRLDKVDGDLSFLHWLLNENVSEGDVLRPWAKDPVSRHVQRRCAVDVDRKTPKSLRETQFHHHASSEE